MESVALVKIHYRKIGVNPGWTREKFLDLCRILSWTPYELGAICAASKADVNHWLKKGRVSATASLHMAMIKAVYIEVKIGQPTKPLMPVHLLAKK